MNSVGSEKRTEGDQVAKEKDTSSDPRKVCKTFIRESDSHPRLHPKPIEESEVTDWEQVRLELESYYGQRAKSGRSAPDQSDNDSDTSRNTAITVLLSNGGHCLIDWEDWPKVSGYRWAARGQEPWRYARAHIPGTGRNGKELVMHRLIMDAPSHLKVDHINGDTFDNRKSNLRICTNAQNVRNSKTHSDKRKGKFKGVYFERLRKSYRAQIMCQYKKINLGNFPTEEAAAQAYDEAARKLFGQFARLNFPPTPEAE